MTFHLFQRGCYPVVAVPTGGGHEGVTRVNGEAHADADAEDDLDRRDGAQRHAPEMHQSGDTDHHADH